MEIRVDVDELRDYMEDYCGSAAFSGFTGAMADVIDIDNMNGHELCKKVEDMGIDLRRFEIDD